MRCLPRVKDRVANLLSERPTLPSTSDHDSLKVGSPSLWSSQVGTWVCFMLYLFATTIANAEAGWNDPNIVRTGGRWVQVAYPRPGLQPPAPYGDSHRSNMSIITVLVAALRETRCPAMLLSAFSEAAHPDRVRVGLVQQNSRKDADCLSEACAQSGFPLVESGDRQFANPNNCTMFDKVRVIRMLAKEAAGPVFARARQIELVNDEDDFCMQIDAHTKFGSSWDVRMLREWGAAENEYAVLTAYPTNVDDLQKNSNNHWEMPHMCGGRFLSPGVLSNSQAAAAAGLTRPMMSSLWAAGLSFSKCHAERHVPADPNLRQIFSGEEFGRGARLWTHGYDFYSITRPIIGTYYGSFKGGKGGWHHVKSEAKQSRERLATLLSAPNSDQSPEAKAALGKYALGTRRTLAQYAEFSGVNPMTGVARKRCLVDWVPWNDDDLRDAATRDTRVANRARWKRVARLARISA